jgi:uroporphyrinogen-III synthase
MLFKVLITRPREEWETTSKVFKKHGFQPSALPLIEFRPLEFELPRPLEEFDYIYFGSKRAAKFFLQKVPLKRRNKTPKVIAVGEKTALYLKKHFNIETDIVLNGYSEQLIEFAERGIISPGKLLAPLPKVNTGNIEKLGRKNFEVYTLPVYETLPIKYDLDTVEQAVKNTDIVFFASPSAVNALIENLQNKTELLLNRIIVAIGNTTERALKEANLKVDFKPSRPNVEVLAKELAEALNGTTKRENP